MGDVLLGDVQGLGRSPCSRRRSAGDGVDVDGDGGVRAARLRSGSSWGRLPGPVRLDGEVGTAGVGARGEPMPPSTQLPALAQDGRQAVVAPAPS